MTYIILYKKESARTHYGSGRKGWNGGSGSYIEIGIFGSGGNEIFGRNRKSTILVPYEYAYAHNKNAAC